MYQHLQLVFVFDRIYFLIQPRRPCFEPVAFERCRRAEYGMRIRALGQAAGLADSLARSAFAGTDCLRGFELLPQLTAEECAAFVSEHLAPERLALAVVQPEPRKDM